jgi:hypothetical protein
MVDGEASCFNHPTKRAAVACDACGRFLCPVCDIEVDKRHYCAGCFQKGAQKGSIQTLERQRTRYDNIAMSLVTLPLLFSCAVVLTAPAALYVIFRYWKAAPSLVHRSRVRLVLSGVMAVLEILGVVGFILFLVYH